MSINTTLKGAMYPVFSILNEGTVMHRTPVRSSIIRLIAFGLTAMCIGSPLFFVSSCTASNLTSEEHAKLDPLLQRLIADDTALPQPSDVTMNADGTRSYGIIVRTSDAPILRTQGFNVSSVFGDVVVVRATVKDILRLARIQSVRSISVGLENQPH